MTMSDAEIAALVEETSASGTLLHYYITTLLHSCTYTLLHRSPATLLHYSTRCAAMSDAEITALVEDTSASGPHSIVRNRGKVESVRHNAR